MKFKYFFLLVKGLLQALYKILLNAHRQLFSQLNVQKSSIAFMTAYPSICV